MVFLHLIDLPKNSQNFVEKAHYPDATPLKISIRLIQSQPEISFSGLWESVSNGTLHMHNVRGVQKKGWGFKIT